MSTSVKYRASAVPSPRAQGVRRCVAKRKTARFAAKAAAGDSMNYGEKATVGQIVDEYAMTPTEIKAALLDSFWGTERGLTASSETRAEINELITQLEAQSPNPKPTEVMDLLDGSWKLVYTSNSELMALLALSRLPFVSINDITQSVDSKTLTVENKMTVTVPFSRTSFSTTASLEVRSPQRLQLKFEKGTVSTPQLMTDVDVPDSVSVMGQSVDLTSLKESLSPVRSAGNDFISQVANIVQQQPNLNIPISNDRAQTWLLTTYLDEDTRISRGDGGSIFVLVKEVSIAPAPATQAYVAATDQIEVIDNDAIVDLT